MKCENCTFWSMNTDSKYPAHLGLGKCKRVKLFWNCTEWEKPDCDRLVFTKEAENNKAFVQDGSDYKAELITLKDFGCVQFVNGQLK